MRSFLLTSVIANSLIECNCVSRLFCYFTTIVPVICGWMPQKYGNSPASVNVNENLSSVSSALDLIGSGHFSNGDTGFFRPLLDVLMHGDKYMHLADLKSYLEADKRMRDWYADPREWARKAILNVASSGRFSSDRTISEYANEIWGARACPIS